MCPVATNIKGRGAPQAFLLGVFFCISRWRGFCGGTCQIGNVCAASMAVPGRSSHGPYMFW